MANLSMKIKDLAVDENTSVTALVEEAIELLFAMRSGKGHELPVTNPVIRKGGKK
jgi:NTP pyrophosphatase (non-canonical NTP hydrolase)